MAASLCEAPLDLEDLLYRSVVDDEFRALILAAPAQFGLSGGTSLTVAVEGLDTTLIDLTAGPTFVAQCGATCSFGPFTIVCDGGTK